MIRRPQSTFTISHSYPRRSLFDILFWIGMAALGIFFAIGLIGMAMSDGIWTDPSTGCRYRVGGGESVSYSPLLLPNGLPDCRTPEVTP